MKISRVVLACLTLLCPSLCAQTRPKLSFEVASIKPLPSLQTLLADVQSGKASLANRGMRVDGARVDIGLATMSSLISMAYKVKAHQISGPDWMTTQLFEIHATLPSGATKEQVPEMIQTLLAERFKLKAHQEKEQPVYVLIVAKGGPKLKEAVEESDPPAPAADASKPAPKNNGAGKEVLSVDTPEGQMKIRQEGRGITVTNNGNRRVRVTMGENNSMRMEIDKVKMSEFADILTQFVDRPVVDKTELSGKYQVALEISRDEILNLARRIMPDLPISNPAGLGGATPASGLTGMAASDPSGTAIFQAIQQLGLKLDSQKTPMETILVDSVEKNPTED